MIKSHTLKKPQNCFFFLSQDKLAYNLFCLCTIHILVQKLQDEGLIFLWVTGRAMELGRECLKIWGYERVDELIWVKTNQLQRIIRTGMYCTYSLIEQDPVFNCKFQCYIFQVGQGIGLIMEKNIV